MTQRQKGFALLYTVLVVTLILTIAISISNVSYKQGLLSSLVKDSQIAFYQADSGIECALYLDNALNLFPYPTPNGSQPPEIACGDEVLLPNMSESGDDYFVYEFKDIDTTAPCFSFLMDKTQYASGLSVIQSRGHNRCSPSPRQVERALEIRY